MTNLYWNYFIQNLIKNSNFKQINLIYTYIQKDYVLIAKDYSGTHVLQKLLDYNNILFNNNCISNSLNKHWTSVSFSLDKLWKISKSLFNIIEPFDLE